ncbi:MAG: hypothetical protein ACQEXV_02845 [Bacillota bacterium]
MRQETFSADITVAGGGLAGVCAAVAAARHWNGSGRFRAKGNIAGSSVITRFISDIEDQTLFPDPLKLCPNWYVIIESRHVQMEAG